MKGIKNTEPNKTKVVVDIIEDDLVALERSLLNVLLKDRTTGKNITWATDDYISLGDMYAPLHEIKPFMITGKRNKVIQPRVKKSQSNKDSRTKGKAEVFTPSWICNEQNNRIDEGWFGRIDVFNKSTKHGWQTVSDKIEFPNTKGKNWTDYVDARRIEMACGEAPYLVSRYDTVSGKKIDVIDRIGLLDRKMRVVNENTNTLEDWWKWTKRAFQSTYGYEYQGDNLLLARENLIYTFIENFETKFGTNPGQDLLKKIAYIVSWNLWQMDGTTCTVPECEVHAYMQQLELFGVPKTNCSIQACCQIKDWRRKKIVKYVDLLKKD